MKAIWKSEKYIKNLQKKLTIRKMVFDHGSWKMKEEKLELFDWDNFVPSSLYIYNTIKKEDRVFPKKCVDFQFKEGFEYRPAQQTIINKIKERLDNKKPFGLIHGKTALGKTVVQMGIIDLYKCKTLIVCPNKALTAQMVDDFNEFSNYEIWIYDSWKKAIRDITVTTASSFSKKNGQFDWLDYDLLLVDECHKWLTEKFIKAVVNSPAKCIYGLSWTPFNNFFDREKQKDWSFIYSMQEFYGWVISDDINDNYNYTPDFYFYDYSPSINYEFETYHEQRSCFVEDEQRLEKQMNIVTKLIKDREVIMILSDRKAELNYYYDYLSENSWINTILITGDTKPKEDNKKVKEFLEKDKRLIIIGTSSKLGTWYDLSVIDTVFLYQPIKQAHTVVQCIWRWMRKHEGKKNPLMVFWGDQSLPKQKKEKIKVIKDEYWNDVKISQFKINGYT